MGGHELHRVGGYALAFMLAMDALEATGIRGAKQPFVFHSGPLAQRVVLRALVADVSF